MCRCTAAMCIFTNDRGGRLLGYVHPEPHGDGNSEEMKEYRMQTLLERPSHSLPEPSPGTESALRDGRWMALGLDCVDYPMLCVRPDRTLRWANRAARQEMADPAHPLRLAGEQLRWRDGVDPTQVLRALREAFTRGLRSLVVVGESPHQLTIAAVPLLDGLPTEPVESSDDGVLLTFSRRRLCPSLTTDWFARDRGLTAAETRVLQSLADGLRPSEIARRQSVALSTVRTQLRSLRAKAGASDIRDLIRQLSRLPPMPAVM